MRKLKSKNRKTKFGKIDFWFDIYFTKKWKNRIVKKPIKQYLMYQDINGVEGHGDGADENVRDGQGGDEEVRGLTNLSIDDKTD